MQRRRLLTLTVPGPLKADEAEQIARAVQHARRGGLPLVMGHEMTVKTHDLGPRATVARLERTALAGRAPLLRRRRIAGSGARRDRVRATWQRERADAFHAGRLDAMRELASR